MKPLKDPCDLMQEYIVRWQTELLAFSTLCEDVRLHKDTLVKENTIVLGNSASLEGSIKNLRDELDSVRIENKVLNDTIQQMREENEGFRKVSQLIAWEKESNRLKEENRVLQEKVDRLHAQLSKPQESKPEVERQLHEKKIKGITYFVDDDNVLYQRLESGMCGERVGELSIVESTGKTKVVWDK